MPLNSWHVVSATASNSLPLFSVGHMFWTLISIVTIHWKHYCHHYQHECYLNDVTFLQRKDTWLWSWSHTRLCPFRFWQVYETGVLEKKTSGFLSVQVEDYVSEEKHPWRPPFAINTYLKDRGITYLSIVTLSFKSVEIYRNGIFSDKSPWTFSIFHKCRLWVLIRTAPLRQF